jgi:hypothetical protein
MTMPATMARRAAAATGLGGTAPRPAPSPLPWLALIAAGAIVTGTVLAGRGVHRYRATR